MAGKGLIPRSPSTSTFDLSGEPIPANGEGFPLLTEYGEPLSVTPLDSRPPGGFTGEGEPSAGLGGVRPNPPVRPNPSRPASAPRSAVRSLFPGKAQKEKVRDSSPYKRPTTGVIKPRRTPDASPAEPRIILGARTPTGRGKGLSSPSPPTDMGVEESTESSPAVKTVRRRLSPPPVRRPAGQIEDSEERGSPGPTISRLAALVLDLRKENRRLAEKVAEGKIERLELRDELDTLRKGLCAKMRRLYKSCGKEELYNSP